MRIEIKTHTGSEYAINHYNDMHMVKSLGFTIMSINDNPVVGLCENCKLPYTEEERFCKCLRE